MRFLNRWIAVLALCTAPLSLQADTLETVYFRANLSPAQEVPQVEAPFTSAKSIITMHIRRDTAGVIVSAVADFALDYDVPTPALATGLYIHKGSMGANGGIVMDGGLTETKTAELSGDGRLFRQVVVTDALGLAALRGLLTDPSRFYINVHTMAQPNGLFRGQLTRMERIFVRSDLSWMNIVPGITGLNSTGSGSAEVLFSRDANGQVNDGSLYYDLNFQFPHSGATVQGAHIHAAAEGVTGPGQLQATLPNNEPLVLVKDHGKASYRTHVQSAEDLAVLNTVISNPADAYLNLHTDFLPEGAMRGQLEPTTEISYHFPLSPLNQVPPAAIDASGFAKVSIFAARDIFGEITSGTVVIEANYAFADGITLQGFHLREGAPGVIGPVVISTGISVPNKVVDEDGVGNLYYRINIGPEDVDGLASIAGIIASPENFYLNMHTSANPMGALRGQLSGRAAAPVVSEGGVVNAAFASGVSPASPGSLISIFGSDLSQASAGSIVVDGKLINNIAGVEVRIGGILAPLVYVSPTQINAQVPFEINPGETSVVVSTAGGVSTPQIFTVASSSPSIFVVVKASDFSRVTAENPAAPGEAVAVFATGLGAGNPAVMTGQTAPSNPASVTSVVPVSTVGGLGAAVSTSVLAPGFVGVCQVNVFIPVGTPSGEQQLEFSVDGIPSNSVTIYVQ